MISGTLRKVNTLKLRKSRRWRDMSIEDRVRELNGGTYTKKELFRRGSSVNLGYYPTDRI